MLHKISIENFFSIADVQELDFTVFEHAPQLPCFRPSAANASVRLPTVIGFFGPNASGKSTVLRAMHATLKFASMSFETRDSMLEFQAYRQKKWLKKPTKILIEFDGKLTEDQEISKFCYELHIVHAHDFHTKKIIYEALSYAPKGKYRVLFKRTENEIYFGKEFGIANENDPRKDSIRPNASVISTLEALNHSLSIYISTQLRMLQSYGFDEKNKLNDLLTYYFQDKKCLNDLNTELRRFDLGLESMSVEWGRYGLFAKFQHTGLDGSLLFYEESEGTQRFIDIFPRLHYALQTGSIAIIDEIDTDVHPLLLPELFRWFSSPERNPLGAQLLFTAHNPTLLDELEKEQIFFTEKLCGQPTIVYGARDIKGLRREPSLMKKYLSGELGAVPHIG